MIVASAAGFFFIAMGLLFLLAFAEKHRAPGASTTLVEAALFLLSAAFALLGALLWLVAVGVIPTAP